MAYYIGFLLTDDELTNFVTSEPKVYILEPRFNVRTGEREADEKVLVSGGDDIWKLGDIQAKDESEFVDKLTARLGCEAVYDTHEAGYVFYTHTQEDVVDITKIDKKALKKLEKGLKKLGLLEKMNNDKPVIIFIG